MNELIHSIMHWVSIHPHLTGFMVGVIACGEALAFIGLVVPGSALMLATGALVGAGLVDFWTILVWAVGGAVVGDGVSYWIGHHYHEQLKSIQVLRRHPQWLVRGTDFFHRHGGKSILLARFVGPVRPVIPVVAGMLGMSPIRFYLINVLSALVWAPAHLLAGMIVGVSLVIAGQVATRLVIVLVILFGMVWLIMWLVRYSYQQIQPHAVDWLTTLSNVKWIADFPRLQRLFSALYDSERQPTVALIIWLGLLIAAMWLFLGVLEDVLDHDPLVYAGQAVYHFLQHLRTPLGDRIMIGITELGDAPVILPLAIAVFAYLLWRRAWRDSLYWFYALGFGFLAVTAIKMMLKIPRPISLYSGAEFYSFPSGHATMSTVIYGLIAVFIASSIKLRWRWIIYACAVLLVSAIAFSRLYLGAHWLADVTAGIALGTVGVALIHIVRVRHQPDIKHGIGLVVVTVGVFISAVSWHMTRQFDHDLKRYAIQHPVMLMSKSDWLANSCYALSTWRVDLGGEQEQPLNVQWAGDLASIEQTLLSHGWHKPLTLSMNTALAWLLPHPSISELPILPQLNDGKAEVLVLVHNGDWVNHKEKQLILRLWPTLLQLDDSKIPVWVGTVATQHLMRLPLITFPVLDHNYLQPIKQMQQTIPGISLSETHCSAKGAEHGTYWDGTIVQVLPSNR